MAKTARCPKCGSTNFTPLGRNRKGFSVGKMVSGAALAGGVGALAGFIGKKGKLEFVCNDCGAIYKPKRGGAGIKKMAIEEDDYQQNPKVESRASISSAVAKSYSSHQEVDPALVWLILFPPVGIPLYIKNYKNEKRSRKTKIIISTIWGLIWLIFLVSVFAGQKYTAVIDGSEITISCNYDCQRVKEYDDGATLDTLIKLGARSFDDADYSISNNAASVKISREKNAKTTDYDAIKISYFGNSISTIALKEYPSVIIYSSGESDAVVNYSDVSAMSAVIKQAQDEKEAEEKAAQAQREAEKKAAAEDAARRPSSVFTRTNCENNFNKNYPYRGTTVHNILGVIADQKYGENGWFYKVKVTIANAYGATYDSVLECVVVKNGENDYEFKTFYVY